MKRLLLLGIMTLTLSLAGCYSPFITKAAVEQTCELSQADRAAVREKLDKLTAPNKVRVYCADEEVKEDK